MKLSNKHIVIVYLLNEKEQIEREENICIISITDETVTDITDENVTNDEAGMRAAARDVLLCLAPDILRIIIVCFIASCLFSVSIRLSSPVTTSENCDLLLALYL